MARRQTLVLVVALLVATGDMASAAPVLTTNALGPVRLGMTLAQAERALGTRLRPEQQRREESCWYAKLAHAREPAVGYMIEHGRVTRIHVTKPLIGRPVAVRTEAGAGIGTSLSRLQRLYGPTLSVGPCVLRMS
jgi:hypothetical protein